MQAYSYVCVITRESFYPGLCALVYSLKRVHAKYPLTVIVPSNADNNLLTLIQKLQLDVIVMPQVDLPTEFQNRNPFPRWNETFFKLQVFNLTQFKKIVFLDLDMIVVRNIDELFQKPHLAAVPAGYCDHPTWKGMNSGLMVVEPNASFYDRLIQSIPEAGERRLSVNLGFGDQDVINFCFPDWWEKKELVLSEIYNAMSSSFETVCKMHGFSNIHVFHFAEKTKPWQYTAASFYSRIVRLMLNKKFNWARMSYIYWKYVRKSCPNYLQYV